MREARLGGDVGEGGVAIVLEEMRSGLFAGGEAFEAGTVDEENVEPAVVVVVVEGDTTSGGLEEIFVFVLAPEDGFGVEPGLASHIEKSNAEIGRWCRNGRELGRRRGVLLRACQGRFPPGGASQGEDILEGKNKRGAAQRSKECPA